VSDVPKAKALAGVNVSRETEALLDRYVDLVKKWTTRINLISTPSVPAIWDRHVLDSVQLYHDAPAAPFHWVDIGSGGGFPGIVIAVLARAEGLSARFTLVESDQRKATFLKAAARELGLAVTVLTTRIEETAPLSADILSARAMGPLTNLINHAARHLAPAGKAVFPKGRTFQTEIDAARHDWRFDLTLRPSMTDPEAKILTIGNITHV
jgi:16S rRNA (guanine527-N7)-methyltransferase